jgi:hypothetical protein
MTNKGLLLAAGTLGVVLAVTILHAQHTQPVVVQGGANSAQRQAVQNAPGPAAPGYQTCDASPIALPSGVATAMPTTASVVLPTPSVVVLTFSTEILAPAGGTVNVDYSIDGGPIGPIGPEFFADDSLNFVTRTQMGATIPPFTGPLSAGFHTIQPYLTAFGGAGTAFFKCFTAQ